MNPKEFVPDAPGEVVRIRDGWAFLAALLPVARNPSVEVFRKSEEARGVLGEFLGEARRIPNSLLVTRPLLVREAMESNRLEGTHTQTEEVLLGDAGKEPKDEERRDSLREVAAYRAVLDQGETSLDDGQPLSRSLVLSLHRQLLQLGRGADKHPGEYRLGPVAVGGASLASAPFVPAPPEHVPSLMDNLLEYMAEPPEFTPLITCATIHYQFEAIHPFEDGNGRMGRLLIPLYLKAVEVIDRAVLYLSPYFEEHRDEYVSLLKRVSTHGDWESWTLFFLKAVMEQALDAKRRVGAILELQTRFQQVVREQSSSGATLSAVDVVMEKAMVSVRDVLEYANCTYPTGRAALNNLTRLGIVEPMEDTYPQLWASRELLRRAYS